MSPGSTITTETAQALAVHLHELEQLRSALISSSLDDAPAAAEAYLRKQKEGKAIFGAAYEELGDGEAPQAETPPVAESPEQTPGGAGAQPGETVQLYSRDQLPEEGDPGWAEYHKKALTRAIRIEGPFAVQVDGDPGNTITIEDGFLAIDARGYPYPIATEEFELIYEPAGARAPGETTPRPVKEVLAEIKPQLEADADETDDLVAAIDGFLADDKPAEPQS